MVTTSKAPASASAEVKAAEADRFIRGKSAHALLAAIGAGTPLPSGLTAQDIGAADARRFASKMAARAA